MCCLWIASEVKSFKKNNADFHTIMQDWSVQLQGKIAMVRLLQQRVRDLNAIQTIVTQTLLGKPMYKELHA